jgi:hypothetical protein
LRQQIRGAGDHDPVNVVMIHGQAPAAADDIDQRWKRVSRH